MNLWARFVDSVKCFYFSKLLLKVSVELTRHTVLKYHFNDDW